MSNWKTRMLELYGSDEKQELAYWYGTMSDERKTELAQGGYEGIDKTLVQLLNKGYRIVKSSAFTPKGTYNNQNTAPLDAQPNADNLFFEQNFNPKEFMAVYNKYGRYENNFPIYFDGTEESYAAYAQKSDIFVLEEIATNRPVGFASFQLIEAHTPEAKELEEEGVPTENKLIYNDTIAICPTLQGKGIGKLFAEALDRFYIQNFGTQNTYALCTGAINTNDHKQLALRFHAQQRGFSSWIEHKCSLEKWMKRWKNDNIEKKEPNCCLLSCCAHISITSNDPV